MLCEKGERGTQIVLYKPLIKQTENDEESFLLMRSFVVFNAEQCGGCNAEALLVTKDVENSSETDFSHADHVIEATGAKIQHGSDRAVYLRSQDLISLPSKSQFITLADYYETAFHELCHWTEHSSRLNWNRAEGGYALSELIAEIGACFITHELGLPNSDNLTQHATYLQHWLEGMKGDPKFIFKAAGQASKAANFILSFSRASTEPLQLVRLCTLPREAVQLSE